MNRNTHPVHAVIVGAGPYGLSLAAHLRESGVPFRIFGRAMQSWSTQMPAGMKLKSDGFASNLSSGSVPFTLEDFCNLTGRPYHATQLPVAVEDFVAYGREFAARFVPNLEERNVAAIAREGVEFRVTIEGGDSFLASNVIIATGVSLFQYVPEHLAHLPADLVTHTTDHHVFDYFAGRDVTVLGRGASTLNAAALAHEIGARVTLLSRKHKIHVHRLGSGERSLYQKLRHPQSPLGSSLRSWAASTVPGFFRMLPAAVRRAIFYKHLGPAGGTALRGRVEDKFPMLLGWSIESAELIDSPNPADRRVRLNLINAEMDSREHITSHVIAGTGFRVNVDRYRFLSQALRTSIRTMRAGGPALSGSFESSVKGLYLVGPVAQHTFGPLLRFAAGAEYAAHKVTAKLVRDLARTSPAERTTFTPQPATVRSTAK